MFLLRETDRSVTEICLDVGFSSLGTFSRTFREVVGSSPAAYRQRAVIVPGLTCFMKAWTRPWAQSSTLEDAGASEALSNVARVQSSCC